MLLLLCALYIVVNFNGMYISVRQCVIGSPLVHDECSSTCDSPAKLPVQGAASSAACPLTIRLCLFVTERQVGLKLTTGRSCQYVSRVSPHPSAACRKKLVTYNHLTHHLFRQSGMTSMLSGGAQDSAPRDPAYPSLPR
jgi:hypothetical protein